MSETQKQIEMLKRALPGAKEKLFSVLALLLISVVMVGTATYAWVTLSTSPEISGISTTVTANGNLEIALSDKDGLAPDASQIGDSVAAGKNFMQANLAWGNLVNLTEGYGLDHFVLRPAYLNTNGLAVGESPLWGAKYEKDGRISKLEGNYAYTTWQEGQDGNASAFVVPNGDAYGVRAISSTHSVNLGGDKAFRELCNTAEDTNINAGQRYIKITQNQEYMNAIAGLMGVYISARFETDAAKKNPDVSDYIEPIHAMLEEFYQAALEEGEALADLANTQQFLKHSKLIHAYNWGNLKTAKSAQLAEDGVDLPKLETYKSTMLSVEKDRKKIADLYEGTKIGTAVRWNDISGVVNGICHIDSCKITVNGKTYTIADISGHITELIGSDTKDVAITKGYLHWFEEMSGANMFAENLKISATINLNGMSMSRDITANVHTDLHNQGVSEFNKTLKKIKEENKGEFAGDTLVAEDTYGLALDFWVRTNSMGSVLTLEGNVITVEEDRQVTVDVNGKSIDVYTSEITKDGQKETVDVVKIEGKWYTCEDQIEITPVSTPTPKIEKVKVVTDYKGDNRVWEGDPLVNENNTMQGNGSCYVFYAETPEDSARTLKLLKNIKIAFADINGKVLATATFDTEWAYSDSGKYTVPMVITQTSASYLDETGETQNGITRLTQNQATRITAILYLDGTELANEHVLADTNLNGKLNIQFGTSTELNAAKDEKLALSEISITAAVDKNEFDFNTDTDFKTNLIVNINGYSPKTVTASFQYAINANHGKKLENIEFAQDGESWKGEYTFKTQGRYRLIAVTVDGVEYDLKEPVEVNVKGFGIQSVYCDKSSIMTAESLAAAKVEVAFATQDTDKLPKKAEGRFMGNDGNSVNVNLTRDAIDGKYKGEVRFVSSGVYTLQYLVLDGNYVELEKDKQHTVDCRLNLRTRVYLTRTTVLDGESADNLPLNFVTSNLGNGVDFKVSAVVTDGNGEELQSLNNVSLQYLLNGSDNAANGMYANLSWNPAARRYEGEFSLTKFGIYSFAYLTAGENQITVATAASMVTARVQEPPKYTQTVELDEYNFEPTNEASVTVRADFSVSAESAIAVFTRKGESAELTSSYKEKMTVPGNPVAMDWTFPVPQVSGTQEGVWTLTELRFTGVTDKDGTEYTEDNPYIVNITNKPEFEVVCDVTVKAEFEDSQNKVFGKDADGNITDEFMQEHKVDGLTVTIADKQGRPLPNVDNVVAYWQHVNGSSYDYGSYTSQGLTGVTEMERIVTRCELIENSKTQYKLTESPTLQLAGKYELQVKFSVNGHDYELVPGDETKLIYQSATVEIFSKKPTVMWTAADPAVNKPYSVNIGGGTSPNTTNLSNRIWTEYPGGPSAFKRASCLNTSTKEDLTVDSGFEADKVPGYYLLAYYKWSSSCGGSFTASRATAQLTGGGSFDSATMTVKSKSYPGQNFDSIFSFGSGSTATADIGSKSGASRRTLGETSVSEISMTYKDITFTVDLAQTMYVINIY